MQIHELNNYNGELDSEAFVAVDDGNDTGKVSVAGLLADINAEITQLDTELNGRIDNIIAGGTAPSEAEIIDARRGGNGIDYASLGAAIRGQYDDLKSALLSNISTANASIIEWESGAISSADGTEVINSTRIRTAGYVPKWIFSVLPEDGYKVVIAAYEGDTYIGCWNGTALVNSGTWFTNRVDLLPILEYNLRFVFGNVNDTTMYVSRANNLLMYVDNDIYQLTGDEYILGVNNHKSIPKVFNDILYPIEFEIEQGYWNANSGAPLDDNSNTRSKDFLIIVPSLTIRRKAPQNYVLILFDEEKNHLGYIGWESQDIGYNAIISQYPTAKYFKLNINVPYADTDPTKPHDYVDPIGKIIDYFNAKINDVKNNIPVPVNPNGYVYGADFLKKPLLFTLLGSVYHYQGFCRYNGYYYSVDGSNIYKQDSDFNLVDQNTANTGHGNSFQVGADGYGYVSGWNDNKVYKIDFGTLSVVETITLPTTGYTTVAVDTVNGYMYIFQRDTYPSDEAAYNLIKYDYINDQIINTCKTSFKFAAMQACDFFEGKILVMYGLGTNVAPSGMVVFNTSGDVLTRYYSSIIENTEPEGVCFDRDTKELLISLNSKAVYLISVN